MAKVLHEVLVDYNLTDKVKKNLCFFIFFAKYLFFKSYA